MPDKIISSSERSACFNWGRLLFSASFPLVLGIFSIIFTIQQNSISQANREQDQRQANELRQQNIYDAYINDISKLLLSPTFNRSNPQQLNYIGFKTVDIIKHLSNAQKRDVIFFLYNHELIRRDKPISQRVNLTGADLADVHFIQSTSLNCYLRDINLGYILASNIVFDKCDISFGVFQGAWLVGAKFMRSLMHGSKFQKANLTDAIFDGNNINQISFPHATLINSKFLGMKPFITDFTNADLLNSDLTNKDLSSMKHIIRNTRFPNGSFSVVDNSQLIIDGGAEDACNRSLRKKDWMVFEKSVGLDFYNTNSTNLNIPSGVSGNCYFGKNKTGVLYQYVSKISYSLLINHEIAYFNLSALMGCTIPNRNNDHALIDVRCFDEFHSGPVCGGIRTNKTLSGFHYYTTVVFIPKGTVHLRIWIEVNIKIPSNSIDSASILDSVKNRLVVQGIDVGTLAVTNEPSCDNEIARIASSKDWNGVIVGYGVRNDTDWFERVLQIIHSANPNISLIDHKNPDDVENAIERHYNIRLPLNKT
ncbi:hypothetical protein I4U23_015457 [Adineta vaga]|nr:hypothetical protein I4U23_015457 [Adineta vaga]